MNTQYYLNCEECKKVFSGKEIYIFGTGVDAETATQSLSEFVKIKAYVDNYRSGNIFGGKEILSLAECVEQKKETQRILIASYRFGLEIAKQLESHNLTLGCDFYIWDDMYIFHGDAATKRYINFMSNIWKNYKRTNSKNIVLLPFDNRHDLNSAIYAYCGNYFAQKYDAIIQGYFRGGSSYTNASPLMKEIYAAFNVESLID